MSRYDHTPIFQSTYILTIEIYKITKNFGKEYKYTLGERLKNISHDLLELIMNTNSAQGKEKLAGILLIDKKKEILIIHLRLAFDLKLIGGEQLGIFNRKIEEIGKQLGGWQKWANSISSLSAPAGVSKS
jgi:hypothetical protein